MARTWTLDDTWTFPSTDWEYFSRGHLAVNPTKTTVYIMARDTTGGTSNTAQKVYSWNGSTLQDISGSVFTATDFNIHDICMFNGVLYVVHTFDSSNEGRISRWNGGQSWSTIWNLEDESATKGVLNTTLADARYLDSNNGRLVVSAEFASWRQAASSDGTTFTMQTIDGSTTQYLGSPPYTYGASKYFAYTSSVVNQRANTNPIADTDGDDDWVDLSASNIGTQTLIGYGDNKSFWNTGQYSTDWGVTISGSASQIKSVWGITSSIVMGVPVTPAYRARTWNTGTNAWDDDGDISTSETIRSYFLIGGTLYMVSIDGSVPGEAYVYTAGSVVSYGYTHSADAIPGVIKV